MLMRAILTPLLTLLAMIFLQFYRLLLSPILHLLAAQGIISHCRFLPTCSQYAVESIERFGLYQGSMLAVKRFCRCHPFAKSGFDPVPETIMRDHQTTQTHRETKHHGTTKSE